MKKRNHGDGALYYVPSRNLWKAVIDVGFTPDGTRKQKAVTHRTQAGARAKLRELQREIEKHGAPLNKQITVEAWATTWLDTVCRPQMKPNGLAAYESITRTWIVPTIGRKPVATLKPSDVRAVTQAIMSAGRSSSTALKAFNVLSVMLSAARLEGLCGRNVAEDVLPPKAAVSNRRAMTEEETIAVLKAAAGTVEGTRWWVAILLGLRQSERLGARLTDIDLAAGDFHVQWQLDEIPFMHGCGGTCKVKRAGSCPERKYKVPDGFEFEPIAGRLCFIRPKSGRTRHVPMVAPLVAAMERYLDATKDRPNPHGLVWRNEDGSPILPAQDEQEWRNLLHSAGLIGEDQLAPNSPGVLPAHSARHTTATMMMELGVDAKIVGEIVGHQSEKVTRLYQHVSSPAAQDASGRVAVKFAQVLRSED